MCLSLFFSQQSVYKTLWEWNALCWAYGVTKIFGVPSFPIMFWYSVANLVLGKDLCQQGKRHPKTDLYHFYGLLEGITGKRNEAIWIFIFWSGYYVSNTVSLKIKLTLISRYCKGNLKITLGTYFLLGKDMTLLLRTPIYSAVNHSFRSRGNAFTLL